ncbi:MAG: hypothetical protein HY038_13965 [Nitrospirae bacterium]|nr:hypothetical protein [Nitrospirota bacterium]
MTQTDVLESAIRQELARVGTCSIEELNERLPYYSWNQVFSAIDRLNRRGTLTIQNSGPFHYMLSLTPSQSLDAERLTPR